MHPFPLARLRVAVPAVLAIAALTLACTTAPAQQPPAATSAAPAGAQPTTSPAAQPATKAGTAPANTFVFGRGGDSVKLDPSLITDGESARVTEQIYDTLVMFDGQTTNVKPALAERWETSPDGRTWTFSLRPNVMFHDGTPFNAEAVIFNFERWMDAQHPYHKGGDFAYWIDMFGGYKNDPQTDANNIIESVRATDPMTVEFTLKRPMAPFLNNLAMFPFAIASPTAVMKDVENYFKNPVGTGPFKFVEWVPGDRITVERNPDYWGEKAKVDRVVWRVITDNTARYLELKAGTIHAMEGANPDDVQSARSDPNLKIDLRPSMNVAYIAMNHTDPNLAKKEVRQAIAYAINRQAIVDALYAGIGTTAGQFIPPSVMGHNPDIKPYPYDPEMAKSLLQQAGLAQGFTIDLWYMPVNRPYYPEPKAIAEAYAADLAKVGITANLKTEDWGQYLTDRRAGKFPFWMLGWTGDNGDPDNFLFVFFGRLDTENTWDNPRVRDMLNSAQTSNDKAERERLYKEVSQIIYDEVPRIPVAHTTPPLLFRNNVDGYVTHPTATEFYNTVALR